MELYAMPTQINPLPKHCRPMNGAKTCWVVFLFLFLSGCTAVALTGAGVGVSYTLSNVAYRSFSAPVDRVHDATIAALKKMGIMIDDDTSSESGVTITAETSGLDIVINLEKVTSNTTQVKVDARKNFFLKDKATAAEIINQVGKILGE
ncbi:MAG: DUF3568 family protein [Desulfobacterales bacterium]|jgi:hypothetical protein